MAQEATSKFNFQINFTSTCMTKVIFLYFFRVFNAPTHLGDEKVDTSSIVYAGLALIELTLNNPERTVVYKVKNPCSSRNERPLIIAAAKETKEFIKKACSHFQKGYDAFKEGPIEVEMEGHEVDFNIELLMAQTDGKIKILTTGLGGAYCLLCKSSSEDAHNETKIKEGFEMDRKLDELKELFIKLAKPDKKTGDLIIPREKGDYASRQGLTGEPVLPEDVFREIAVLHAWLRCLGHMLTIIYRVNANVKQYRESLGIWKESKIKRAKKKFQQKMITACSMVLDKPLQGGGNTNTGDLAKRFFSPKNREKIVSFFEGSQEEKECLKKLLQNLNVILRLASCSRKIKTEELNDFCKETMLLYLSQFSWYPMSQSMHQILAHLAERIDLNGGTGIGELSEQGLEATNKEIRKGRNEFARKTGLEANFRDVFKRLFAMSDPIINYLKRESTCDNCYEKGHTSRKCTELMEIADENPTEDGLNFVMSFPLL